MAPVVPPVASQATPQPSEWVFPTAIAGTIGSIFGFGIAFFLSIFVGSTTDALPSTPDAIRDALFWNRLLRDSISGSAFGLSVGTAFAITWEPLIVSSSHLLARWIRTTILSFLLGSVVAWVLHNMGAWYGASALERALFSGLVGGGIAGGMQAPALWQQRAAQWRWTLLHALAFCGVFVLLMLARYHVSSLFLFPLVWLSLWGLYGLCLGTGFDHLQYNYPNQPA